MNRSTQSPAPTALPVAGIASDSRRPVPGSLAGYGVVPRPDPRAAKRLMSSACLAILMLALPAAVSAADDGDFPGIERLMSPEEFRDAGLEGLSAEQLEILNQWLIRYTAGDAELLQETNRAVREARDAHEVESRIVGEFSGWSGNTVFPLENGQVWEQRLDGRYRYRGAPNPAVRIDRNWLGFYRMTIVETGRSVGVSPRAGTD